MEKKALAQTLMRLARRNVSPDNVGRLVLPEVNSDLDVKLEYGDVEGLFKKFFPGVEVELRSWNVVLVWFDGREAVRNLWSMREKVVPELNEWRGKQE
jgi:hypothetical protein